MGTDNVIMTALAASLAAGALCFASKADVTTTAEPPAFAEPAPAGPATATPFTAPRYFNPYTPPQDNPTNPPGTWEIYPSPTSKDLKAVDFVDANNGWANGAGVMLRYRGGSWSVEPGHDTRDYRDLDMVSLTEGWAVGREGSTDKWTIWRWNGSSWNEFQIVTGAIYCIDMIDASHGWIGGKNYFLRFNGTTWEWGGSARDTMYDIQMNSDTDGRALGYHYIMRRQGNNWLLEASNNDWNLGSIYMLDNSEGWAAGQSLNREIGLILKFESFTWKVYKTYPEVRGIGRFSFVGKDWGWSSGSSGIILFYDGKDWAKVRSPTSNSLGVTFCWDKNFGWLMGRYGTILKYKANTGIKRSSLGTVKAIFH